MSTDARRKFYDLLRDRFAPELRRLGFKGSGSNFRRVQGEVVNVINIQGNKYGGSSAVNLGLHLTFLPHCWKNEMPDLAKIKVVDCEFSQRLSPRGRADYWWKYDGLFKSTSDRADHLVRTYLKYGETEFEKFDSVEKVAAMVSLDDIATKKFVKVFGGVAPFRVALTIARIHQHRGDATLAEAFAKAGLENLGRATVLKPKFEEILESL